MKSHPILFSAPMVRALLDGSKTQTRRVLKSQALEWISTPVGFDPQFIADAENRLSPYGQVGDQLWVRETFMDMRGGGIDHDDAAPYRYRAEFEVAKELGLKWKPSIFMPRAASRLTLEITGVRVERLESISEADCIAEGPPPIAGYPYNATPYERYRHLWESINGKGSWDLNPWVWVIEFKRITQPI